MNLDKNYSCIQSLSEFSVMCVPSRILLSKHNFPQLIKAHTLSFTHTHTHTHTRCGFPLTLDVSLHAPPPFPPEWYDLHLIVNWRCQAVTASQTPQPFATTQGSLYSVMLSFSSDRGKSKQTAKLSSGQRHSFYR